MGRNQDSNQPNSMRKLEIMSEPSQKHSQKKQLTKYILIILYCKVIAFLYFRWIK